MTKKGPVVLCILDGWGISTKQAGNAIALAQTPTWDRLCATYPMAELGASGENVGLAAGQMGNSEVGHMTIGAGRVIFQKLPQISYALETGELFEKKAFRRLWQNLKISGKTCHLMGLLSDGGVHSHQKHMMALASFLGAQNIQVNLHLFLDGRDTPPESCVHFLKEVFQLEKQCPWVRVATLMGRYYGMDRDQRWDRTEKAFQAIALGKGEKLAPGEAAIVSRLEDFFSQSLTDEFIPPLVVGGYDGLHQGDAFLVANFRPDRMRQILSALLLQDFTGFDRQVIPCFASCVGMASYSEALDQVIDVLFPDQVPHHTLGEIVAQHGLKQLRAAETEKYAHVTFFLNGGREEPFEKEDRLLVPSPKVTTYDLCPEMSAEKLTNDLIQAYGKNKYDLMVVNYANADMVGHTGKLEAAIKAVETLDHCLAHLEELVLKNQGTLVVTADHGNVETMYNETTGAGYTSHTLNKVPFMVLPSMNLILRKYGGLADVAPTILFLLGLPKPKEMTGESLLS